MNVLKTADGDVTFKNVFLKSRINMFSGSAGFLSNTPSRNLHSVSNVKFLRGLGEQGNRFCFVVCVITHHGISTFSCTNKTLTAQI